MGIAMPFRNGRASVEVDGKWGYIDTKGKWAVEPQFFEALDFSEGLAAVQEARPPKSWKSDKKPTGGKWGFVDPAGVFVIKPSFDGAFGFSEGLAAVKVGDRWGYIDKKGEVAIVPRFANAMEFSEGVAGVIIQAPQYKLEFGYIDKSGKYIIKPVNRFNVFGFSNGLALVITTDDKKIYIDKTGKVVYKPAEK